MKYFRAFKDTGIVEQISKKLYEQKKKEVFIDSKDAPPRFSTNFAHYWIERI